MRRERKRGAVGWRKDTSESDGLGALVGDLPDSGSGKPLVLGHQRAAGWVTQPPKNGRWLGSVLGDRGKQGNGYAGFSI